MTWVRCEIGHLYNVLPYVPFAFILQGDKFSQKVTRLHFFIFDKVLLNFLKEFLCTLTLRNRVLKCLWNRVSKHLWNRALHDHKAHSVGPIPLLSFYLIRGFRSGNGLFCPQCQVQIHTVKNNFYDFLLDLKICLIQHWDRIHLGSNICSTTILIKERTKINNMFTNNQASHIKYI